MKQPLLLKASVFTFLFITINATAHPRHDGFYTGINAGLISFGKKYTETIKDKATSYSDISNQGLAVNIGYQHAKSNRIEFYFRGDNLETKKRNLDIAKVGVNYEIGLSALAADNGRFMPYLAAGYGRGVAVTDNDILDTSDASEVMLSVGVHYQLSDSFDSTLVLERRELTIEDDHNNDSADATVNTLRVGVSYHF
jgi:opacity protein-like surface antigen